MTKIRYNGPLRGVTVLVGMLKREGIDVRNQELKEQRGSGANATTGAVILIGDAVDDGNVATDMDNLLNIVIDRFKEQFHGSLRVDIEKDT